MSDPNIPEMPLSRGDALRRVPRSAILACMLVVACAVGAGATALVERGRAVTYVAITPSPVSTMQDGSQVALEGQVAEIFGNKFVLQDASGRALVETGRRGEEHDLVTKDEKVVVQGRFDHGFVHAISIRHPDGRLEALDPPPPPRRPDPVDQPRPM